MHSATGPPTLPSTRSVAPQKRLPPSRTPVAFPPPKFASPGKPEASALPLANLLPLSPSSSHMTPQELHPLPPNSVPPSPRSSLFDSKLHQTSGSQLQQESESEPSQSLINEEIQPAPPPQTANNATPVPSKRTPNSPPPPIQTPPPLPSPPPPSPSPPPPIPADVSPSTQSSPPPPPPPIFVPPPPPSPQVPERSPPPPLAEPAQNTPSPPPQSQVPQFPPPPDLITSEVSHPSPPASLPSSNSTLVPSTPPDMQTSPPPPSVVSSSLLSPPSPLTAEPEVPRVSSTSGNTPQSSVSTSGSDLSTGDMMAIVLVISFALLGISVAVAFYVRTRKKKTSQRTGSDLTPHFAGSSPESDYALLKVKTSHRNDAGGFAISKFFTYEELDTATDGFSDRNLLGGGGFGSVYKGSLPDGTVIAVKQLKIGGGQGEREFRAEVEIISRIHHRHLVSLVGYCIIDNRRLLVYDYVPNNNLHVHLHGLGRSVLEWSNRVKVAVGAAHGIAYLHEDCHPRVIHRDIKSLNILLDNNFEAQVSDFGLAKLAMDSNSHVTTRVVGTFGYMAPEYASTGKLTEKSDVFSFGVVLLELITGRKPVDTSRPVGQESLVEWARPLLSHALETQEFEQLPDPRLESQYDVSEMFQMIEAAAACVRHSAPKRPTMGQVVRALDSMSSTMDLMNGMKVGESGMLNSQVRLLQRMAFGNPHTTDFFTQDSSYTGNTKG